MLSLSVSSDSEEVIKTSHGKSFHTSTNREGTTSNNRDSNSGNKQIIGSGIPESLPKRGVGDGREMPKILRGAGASPFTTQRPVGLSAQRT